MQPHFFPRICKPNQPAQYVLEVHAGFTDLYGIERGDVITYTYDRT